MAVLNAYIPLHRRGVHLLAVREGYAGHQFEAPGQVVERPPRLRQVWLELQVRTADDERTVEMADDAEVGVGGRRLVRIERCDIGNKPDRHGGFASGGLRRIRNKRRCSDEQATDDKSESTNKE